MLFILIGISFLFIFFISIFGDLPQKRKLAKDKRDWRRIMGYDYE